jgi:diguanylate cyclase (GGDEF)-like protein
MPENYLTPERVYVGNADIKSGKYHSRDKGRIKEITVAQAAAQKINTTYGHIDDPSERDRIIGKFLDNLEIPKEGLDPFHSDVAERIQFENMSQKDLLTGLVNQESFNTALGGICKTEEPVGILKMDLDKFSWINDVLGGHSLGDLYLKLFARHITNTVQLTDVPARIGGDEFAVILKNIRTRADLELITKRIFRVTSGKKILNETLKFLMNSKEEVRNGSNGNNVREYRRTVALRQICGKIIDLRDNVVVDRDKGIHAQTFFLDTMRGSSESKRQFLDNINSFKEDEIKNIKQYMTDNRSSFDLGAEDSAARKKFEQKVCFSIFHLVPEMGVSMAGVHMNNPGVNDAGNIMERLDQATYQIKNTGGDNYQLISI